MVYRDPTPLDPDKEYTIDELAKFIREKIYGRDTREAMAKALEKAGGTAEWAREVAQELIDSSFDEGALNTEIERKLNELEEQYAPDLSEVKTELTHKAQIILSESEPLDADDNTFWYEDRGDADITGITVLNASVSENEPNDNTLWFKHN